MKIQNNKIKITYQVDNRYIFGFNENDLVLIMENAS